MLWLVNVYLRLLPRVNDVTVLLLLTASFKKIFLSKGISEMYQATGNLIPFMFAAGFCGLEEHHPS